LDELDFDFGFKGASFGHMIFCSNKTCFLFDVFTGIEVSSPPLPVDENTWFCYGIDLRAPPPLPGLPLPVFGKFCYGAALTGPLASPNPHLIVYTKSSNFFWPIGSNSWSKCSPRNGPLTKFVVFKDQVFGMGSDRRLFMVHLTPQIHLQEIPVSWGGRNSMTEWHPRFAWLVVCGDMLLMVGCRSDSSGTGPSFEAYHLDTSTEPAKWVKVERLEKWAIFISNSLRVEALSCMNPERWGGRSNRVYCYDSRSGHLVAFELGKPLLGDDATMLRVFIHIRELHDDYMGMVQPTWVVPSMFS
jgi:hypothetical protein